MPIYEYQCHACGHEFDRIQSFSDPVLKKCPECGKLKVKKKISLTSFHLKGEGWYKDGYARPSEKPKKEEKKAGEEPTKSQTPAKDTKTKPQCDQKVA